MKIQGVKAMFGKVMAIGLVAVAVAAVAPAQMEAQQIAFRAQIGAPYHEETRRDSYERERLERERAEMARAEAAVRQEQWEARERGERARFFHNDAHGYAAPPQYFGR